MTEDIKEPVTEVQEDKIENVKTEEPKLEEPKVEEAPKEEPKVEEPVVEKKEEDVVVSEKEIESINAEIEKKEAVIKEEAVKEGKVLGKQEATIEAMRLQLEEQNQKMAELSKKIEEAKDVATQRKGEVPQQSNPFVNTKGKEIAFEDIPEETLKEGFIGDAYNSI